jgi:hypothetical protein
MDPSMTRLLPLLLLLAGCATPPPATPAPVADEPTPPPAPQHPCATDAPRARVTIQPDGTTVEVEPERGDYLMGRLVWRGALGDGDARDVLVRDKEQCDGRGSCPYWLYVGCPDGRSAVAAHIPAAQEVSVLPHTSPRRAASWRPLSVTLRVVPPQQDTRREETWTLSAQGRYAP